MVENDGIGYFSYLHAMVVDRDLDLSYEYAAARSAGVPYWPPLLQTKTATGRPADFFPVGPALLSTPAYALTLLLRQGQYGTAPVAAFTLSSLLAGLLALAVVYRLTGSTPAVAGLAGCTALPYYLLFEPSYSHTFSALAVSLFVWVWWRRREGRSAAGWLLLGLLGGLMALVRFQDGPLMAIALLDLPRARWRTLLLVPGALLAFTPQVVVDREIFGTWLPQRPAGQELHLFSGHELQVLFSSWHGLFTWHPITLLAVVGLGFLRDRALQVAAIYALVVETLINAAAPDWWGGFAFGARRFLDLLPFFGLGLAALPARRLWPVVGVLAAWNVALMANFAYVMRTDHDPGYWGLLAGQLPALVHVPNLLAQGAVGRQLLLWPLLHRSPEVPAGLLLLAGEAVCLVAALALSGAGRRRRALAWPGRPRWSGSPSSARG